MSYLLVEANCRFIELQYILKRHGIELEQTATHWRAVVFNDFGLHWYDLQVYVANLIANSGVDCYVEVERRY